MSTPDIPLVPPGGFQAEDFPTLVAGPVNYTTSTHARPDPLVTIGVDDQMTMALGNIGVVFPDREQWRKLAWMVEALWNSHEQAKQARQEQVDDPQPLPAEAFEEVMRHYEENTNGHDATHQHGPQHPRRDSPHPH
jgi:hypothetical protein